MCVCVCASVCLLPLDLRNRNILLHVHCLIVKEIRVYMYVLYVGVNAY